MRQVSYSSLPYVSVTSGSTTLTYGAWTLLGTTDCAWDGLILTWSGMGQNQVLQLGIGSSSSPFVILENYFANAAGSQPILIPIHIPAGTSIYAQTASGQSASGNATNVAVTGIRAGGLPPEICGRQILSGNVSLSNSNLMLSIAASATIQITSAVLPTAAKRIWLMAGSLNGMEWAVGVGPSTSLVDTLISDLLSYSSQYSAISNEFPIFIPAGQNIFLVNQTTSSGYVSMYYLI